MASRELFKRFSNLCSKWPKDETKAGRDYAEYFRSQLGGYFPHGEQSQISDPQSLDKRLSALERIANDKYYNENPLKRSSSTGLEAWVCRDAISNEGIRALEEDETTVLSRLKGFLNVRFSSSKSDTRFMDEISIKDNEKPDKK